MAGHKNKHASAAIAAAVVLGLTGGAAWLSMRFESSRGQERLADDARAASLRAADAIQTLLASLEAQVQNGTANPRLVAALEAKVDDATLRDLLLTEPWWEPFRRSVDGFALQGEAASMLVASRLPAGFEDKTLLGEVRQSSRARSGLIAADQRTLAVAAAPIALASRSGAPVLVGFRALDAEALAGTAERAGASVALSDGQRLLVAATAKNRVGSDDPESLGAAVALPVSGVGIYGDCAVAARPLGGSLRILAAVASPVEAGRPAIPSGTWALLLVGVLLSIASARVVSRRAARPSPSKAVATPASSTVGRYTLIERLGEGGMAEIYAAVTTGEGNFRRPVVIKRLRPELASDPKAVAQFRDEANLLAAFHHPNIVAVHDFGRWDNRFFLAEEYVPGRDLGRLVAHRFSRDGRPPAPELIAYVAHEVLKALGYAHQLANEQGRPLRIVHRDVSPENIVVTPQGEVKLLDFGIVKAAEGRVTKTEIGMVKGNVSFMAPEQARGMEVDGRADLYSLALVIYFCCTGRTLYTAETVYDRLMQAATGPGPHERELIGNLPKPFSTVVQRATDPDLNRRYANAREMAADLKTWALRGNTPTVALVTDLFGGELRDEARRLAARPVQESSSDLVSFSSSSQS